LQLFGVKEEAFVASQLDQLAECTPQQLRAWMAANADLHQQVEVCPDVGCCSRQPANHIPPKFTPDVAQVGMQERHAKVPGNERPPGFLRATNPHVEFATVYTPIKMVMDGAVKDVLMIQVL
jgi:hypothetical protein